MKIRIYEMSLKDWKAHGLSNRNKKILQIRKSDGTNKNKFKTITYDERDGGSIKMEFEITPTYKGKKDPSGKTKSSGFLNYDKLGSEYTDSKYLAIIELAGITSELENWDEWTPAEKRKKIMKLFDTWDGIKFYCSCPSWLTQGAWKRAEETDSSVYNFPPFSDIGWWELGGIPNKAGRVLSKDKAHDNGGLYLCKHLAGLLEQVKFIWNEVVAELDKHLVGGKIVKQAKKDELDKPEKLPPQPKEKDKKKVEVPVNKDKEKKVIVKKNTKEKEPEPEK